MASEQRKWIILDNSQFRFFCFLVSSCLIANKDTDQGVRYSSRGGQVNYNEDENDWGISSEDDKLPVYTKPVVQEEEGDVIESIHDFRRTGMKEHSQALKFKVLVVFVSFSFEQRVLNDHDLLLFLSNQNQKMRTMRTSPMTRITTWSI